MSIQVQGLPCRNCDFDAAAAIIKSIYTFLVAVFSSISLFSTQLLLSLSFGFEAAVHARDSDSKTTLDFFLVENDFFHSKTYNFRHAVDTRIR